MPFTKSILLVILASNLISLYLGFSWRSIEGGGDTATTSHLVTFGHGDPPFNVHDLIFHLNLTGTELESTRAEVVQLRQELDTVFELAHSLLTNGSLRTIAEAASARESGHDAEEQRVRQTKATTMKLREAQGMSEELDEYIGEKKLPLGWSAGLQSWMMVSPIGHACAQELDNLVKYMKYEAGEECPDDQRFAQALMLHGCEPLPRRRCFARMPPHYREPHPLPKSLWTLPHDDSVLWTAYTCKSFECLNERKSKGVFEDCIDCFELEGRESTRWMQRSSHPAYIDYSIDEVLELTRRGSIRIGLDLGGGPGTFAARMLERNITIVSTSLDLNAPFNSFVALRGLVPLHLSLAHRLPFFDNTLDLVHSMHVLSNWIPTTSLEFVLFDIDRVLRPGGIFWLDRFFCFEHELEHTYLPLVLKLGYKKLRWAIAPKLDRGPELHEVYLSAVLEKPFSR